MGLTANKKATLVAPLKTQLHLIAIHIFYLLFAQESKHFTRIVQLANRRQINIQPIVQVSVFCYAFWRFPMTTVADNDSDKHQGLKALSPLRSMMGRIKLLSLGLCMICDLLHEWIL